ncbi:MAG: DUF3990 domain-containing protein [Lachnospiraceae bacterium]
MNRMTVYHGSYTAVEMPELDKCEDGKDFGKGFYVTTSKSQAERFCKSAVGKALKNGKIDKNQNIGYVSVYEFEPTGDLDIYEFSNADGFWLRCVAGHRKKNLFKDEIENWKEYDILIGKIANDTTNRVITAYINGDYGDPDEDNAVKFAISLLKTDKLSDQECFRSKKAINCLHFVESYEVKINE